MSDGGAIAPFIPEAAAADGAKVFQLSDVQADDPCQLKFAEEANREIQWYNMLQTHGAQRDSLIRFSSGQTNLRYADGFGTPAPDVIDTSSMLRSADAWHSRGRQQLINRTYHAGADLSRGNPRLIDNETAVKNSFGTTTDRSVALSGISIDRFDPAVPPELQAEQHIVPTAWVRGGDNTRESARTLAKMT